MQVLYPRCAGLDVPKRTDVASVCVTDARGHATFTMQTFGTTTPELLALQAWLTEHRVTHVAMEATWMQIAMFGNKVTTAGFWGGRCDTSVTFLR